MEFAAQAHPNNDRETLRLFFLGTCFPTSMDKSSTNHPHIFYIPEELTVKIFQKAIPHSSRRAKALLTITSICRQWRYIALNTPSLWTEIRSSNLEFIRASVDRCRGMPISFSVDIDDRGCAEPMPTILHSLPQIQKLDIQGECFDEDDMTAGIEAWMTPAPILKALDVYNCQFSDNIFAGVAPSLKSLYLRGCMLDLDDLPPLPALKKLFISRPEVFPISIQSLLDKLCWSPLLTSLTLDWALSHEEPQSDIRLSLPMLRYLFIGSEDCEDALLLLDHLAIPATARVKLSLTERDEPDYLRVIDALNGCRTSDMPIRSVRVIVSPTKHIYHIKERDEDGRHASITLSLCGSTLALDAAESALLHLPLDELEVLEVDDQGLAPRLPPTFWYIFQALPHLHTVKVHNVFAWSFLSHFCRTHYEFFVSAMSNPPIRSREELLVPLTLFPALEVLRYEDTQGNLTEHLGLFVPFLLLRSCVLHRLTELSVIIPVALNEKVADDLKSAVGRLKLKVVGGEDSDSSGSDEN
ncbi:hypothetical protein BDN72DRAFT_835966 [Pluteus cervinus]|uniref:Uncharacterized protein n=1 Tax=Pluteus cervinus TaxID=181527 RepID=A0ACD3B2Y2_9AGAR|nr:hypothetical protein BDN72DRAFT_835966 [Pluteus cervinus]